MAATCAFDGSVRTALQRPAHHDRRQRSSCATVDPRPDPERIDHPRHRPPGGYRHLTARTGTVDPSRPTTVRIIVPGCRSRARPTARATRPPHDRRPRPSSVSVIVTPSCPRMAAVQRTSSPPRAADARIAVGHRREASGARCSCRRTLTFGPEAARRRTTRSSAAPASVIEDRPADVVAVGHERARTCRLLTRARRRSRRPGCPRASAPSRSR